ncbi:MAG: DUF1579 family protein [Chloroflexota bacterium]
MKRIAIVLLFSLLIAAAVSAQSDMTPEPTPEATAVAYTLPEEAHQLDWFLGTWNVASRYLNDPATDQWIEDTVSSTIKPIIGGFALQESFTGNLVGAPIDAISVRAYNATIGKWEQRWLDNTSPGFAEYTGEFKDGMFIGYSNRGFSPEIEGGENKTRGTREVFFDIMPDKFSWKLETTTDGGKTWTVIWTLEYTRVA